MITSEMCLQLRAFLSETRGEKIRQTDLARELGISSDSISRYETAGYRRGDPNRVPRMYIMALLYKIDEAHMRRELGVKERYATKAPLPPRLRAALERAESGPETIAPAPAIEPDKFEAAAALMADKAARAAALEQARKDARKKRPPPPEPMTGRDRTKKKPVRARSRRVERQAGA